MSHAVMIATVLFCNSALWAPRPCQSNSCCALSAGPPATRHGHFHGLTGMRARVVTTSMRDPLGKRLEQSIQRPT
eukprot:1767877-Pyramimonas_sp.AAC.1